MLPIDMLGKIRTGQHPIELAGCVTSSQSHMKYATFGDRSSIQPNPAFRRFFTELQFVGKYFYVNSICQQTLSPQNEAAPKQGGPLDLVLPDNYWAAATFLARPLLFVAPALPLFLAAVLLPDFAEEAVLAALRLAVDSSAASFLATLRFFARAAAF